VGLDDDGVDDDAADGAAAAEYRRTGSTNAAAASPRIMVEHGQRATGLENREIPTNDSDSRCRNRIDAAMRSNE